MTMPSEASKKPGIFDRFADLIARWTSKSYFFAFCVALVVVWLPSYLLVRNFDTWQLLINTPTTIVTFVLVALLQNTQKRADDAVQQKLNAIAKYLTGDGDNDAKNELREAVGLEERESSS